MYASVCKCNAMKRTAMTLICVVRDRRYIRNAQSAPSVLCETPLPPKGGPRQAQSDGEAASTSHIALDTRETHRLPLGTAAQRIHQGVSPLLWQTVAAGAVRPQGHETMNNAARHHSLSARL